MKQYARSAFSPRKVSVCIVILLVSSTFAMAQDERMIYAFDLNNDDGGFPSGGLIADSDGNMYGLTSSGAACCDLGTVYELSLAGGFWNETVIYAFRGAADGYLPSGDLVFDPIGNLYGSTQAGGNYGTGCPSGCGVVFELSPPTVRGGSWTQTTLYSFASGNDGAIPMAGVIFDRAGNLYGTTFGGGTGSCQGEQGAAGCGTVFELSPPAAPGGAWTETVLYRFNGGEDGGAPLAPMALDQAGNLYATTSTGSNSSCAQACGTVFELAPSGDGVWIETVIHRFGSFAGDGFNSHAGLLLHKSGAITGTTYGGGIYGGGTVFGLRPPARSGDPWPYKVLYSFGSVGPAGRDGSGPLAPVIQNGNDTLYGTTLHGGTEGDGTVFQLTRAEEGWTETALYSFVGSPSDGAFPEAGLLSPIHSFALYGTTISGGGDSPDGAIFEITQ
jgi:uncharacterized repeat protein (TIGR03803 family)